MIIIILISPLLATDSENHYHYNIIITLRKKPVLSELSPTSQFSSISISAVRVSRVPWPTGSMFIRFCSHVPDRVHSVAARIRRVPEAALSASMELNKQYSVNIVCQLKTGTFVIAPKFNEDTSEQYQNYRKHLLNFKSCSDVSEWFEALENPLVEIGKVVLVKVNDTNTTNEWARGIISKYDNNNLSPEIYLIDTQKFINRNKQYKLRKCPPKYLQLKLPTYTIHIDLCFNINDDNIKNVIELMIKKNQYDELNIIFTPQSVQNNEYKGFLTINNIPLKKYLHILLKQYTTKKGHKLSIFNPLRFHHLKNIFIPKHSTDLVFLDESLVSSCSDLSEMSSCDPLDSSVLDYSKGFSDEESLLKTLESFKNSHISPITKQKIHSPSSSSMSTSNSSTCSLDKELNTPKIFSADTLTNFTNPDSEKHYLVPINLDTTADSKDENKSHVENTISTEIASHDINEQIPFIKRLMKKRLRTLRQKEAECKQNNTTAISKVLETPKKSLYDDSNIWWSSDDES